MTTNLSTEIPGNFSGSFHHLTIISPESFKVILLFDLTNKRFFLVRKSSHNKRTLIRNRNQGIRRIVAVNVLGSSVMVKRYWADMGLPLHLCQHYIPNRFFSSLTEVLWLDKVPPQGPISRPDVPRSERLLLARTSEPQVDKWGLFF